MGPIFKQILSDLEDNNFNISTDTRKNIAGSIYIGIKGETFDGNAFVTDAIKNGALKAITDNKKNRGKDIYVVNDTLKTYQAIASEYRKRFSVPIIVIGGSNGKTTTKELLKSALAQKYTVHATTGSLNNHIGVPASLLSMNSDTEIAVLEIGANHPHEHTTLLNIIQPTHIVVTNNGKDHLDGFGSPKGARQANKELYDWAKKHSVPVFVDKTQKDLMIDSSGLDRILYPDFNMITVPGTTYSFSLNNKKYKTKLTGTYNKANIETALAIAEYFGVPLANSARAICKYVPNLKRSQFVTYEKNDYIVDCYNANPTSMMLSIESFIESSKGNRGLILGDMLELGKYATSEHKKIVGYARKQNTQLTIYIGPLFQKVLKKLKRNEYWFSDSETAREWFQTQKFKKYTFLLKGSRGMKIEKIIDM